MDFLSQLLSKQQAPPPLSAGRKKQLVEAKKAEESRRKYLANYRLQDSSRLKMKFAPADKIVRAIIHELAEEKGLVSHSFGDEGVDRYVYIYKKAYNLTEAELTCYRERRKWDPTQYLKPVSAELPLPPNEATGCLAEKPEEPKVVRSTAREKPKMSERQMVRLSAQTAAVVIVSRESFGNVPVSVKTDKRTMAEVHSDIRAKKILKVQEKISAEESAVVPSLSGTQ